ncbi:hypothetical protein [Streptomyces sp. RK75]|uniref:hypothetical protein n=1 Tax=Streptomyces sp. RK75 TaxID=2824895 RepID=UPI0016089B89|nr:hypothetical protein [Streptomyces sp. RK75]MBQ0863904.1 hypothetical protein [Streptomyces sp. RK75]
MSARGENEDGARRRAVRAARFGCGALLAAPFLLVAVLIAMYLIQRAVPEDYPEAEPEAVARRITGTSAELVRVLDLGGPTVDGWGGQWRGQDPAVDVGPAFCYPDGLEGALEEPVADAFFLSHAWQLEHVPEAEARPAMRRAAGYLRRHGWHVTVREDTGSHQRLRAEQEGDTVGLYWTLAGEHGAGTLEGRAWSPCTYDPTPHGQLPPL